MHISYARPPRSYLVKENYKPLKRENKIVGHSQTDKTPIGRKHAAPASRRRPTVRSQTPAAIVTRAVTHLVLAVLPYTSK